jgi:hypothetical protein
MLHHAEYAYKWNCPHAEHFTSLDLDFPSPVVHIFNIAYGQFIHYRNFADIKILYFLQGCIYTGFPKQCPFPDISVDSLHN